MLTSDLFLNFSPVLPICLYHLVITPLETVVIRHCAFLQSARDIESKMRNETRLKLFTLDADTQVKKTPDKQIKSFS